MMRVWEEPVDSHLMKVPKITFKLETLLLF